MALISAGALWIAATRPYRDAQVFQPIVQDVVQKCSVGAGYYNEGFIALGFAGFLATCIVAVASMDYLGNHS